jgi:hypothetical protein
MNISGRITTFKICDQNKYIDMQEKEMKVYNDAKENWGPCKHLISADETDTHRIMWVYKCSV